MFFYPLTVKLFLIIYFFFQFWYRYLRLVSHYLSVRPSACPSNFNAIFDIDSLHTLKLNAHSREYAYLVLRFKYVFAISANLLSISRGKIHTYKFSSRAKESWVVRMIDAMRCDAIRLDAALLFSSPSVYYLRFVINDSYKFLCGFHSCIQYNNLQCSLWWNAMGSECWIWVCKSQRMCELRFPFRWSQTFP